MLLSVHKHSLFSLDFFFNTMLGTLSSVIVNYIYVVIMLLELLLLL